jgi:hypothetical protein
MGRRRDRHNERPLISGIIWLGIGLLWLGVSTRVLPDFEYSWPAILIIIGLAILASNLTHRRPPSTPDSVN